MSRECTKMRKVAWLGRNFFMRTIKCFDTTSNRTGAIPLSTKSCSMTSDFSSFCLYDEQRATESTIRHIDFVGRNAQPAARNPKRGDAEARRNDLGELERVT